MTKSIFLSSYFEIQSTLLIVRELFVGASFDLTSRLYVKVKQGTPWDAFSYNTTLNLNPNVKTTIFFMY